MFHSSILGSSAYIWICNFCGIYNNPSIRFNILTSIYMMFQLTLWYMRMCVSFNMPLFQYAIVAVHLHFLVSSLMGSPVVDLVHCPLQYAKCVMMSGRCIGECPLMHSILCTYGHIYTYGHVCEYNGTMMVVVHETTCILRDWK